MGAYELIKGDENGIIADPNKTSYLKTEEGYTDMELGSTPRQIPAPQTTTLAIERNPPKSRLVSLDVFRGTTVAVRSETPLSLCVCIYTYLFSFVLICRCVLFRLLFSIGIHMLRKILNSIFLA